MESDNEKTEVESSDDEKNVEPPKKSGSKRMSKTWHFFDRDNHVFATCKICKKSLNHRSGLSNLTKHIKRAHRTHFQRINGDVDPGSFKRIDYTSQDDLLHHLKTKHNNEFIPNKNVSVLVNESNELFELEELTQTKEETNDKYDHLRNLERDESSDSDQPRKKRIKLQPFKKQAKEDQIDLFANYVSCLLRKLPTKVSDKLQADFISQIMEVSVTGIQEQVQVPNNVSLGEN